MDNYFFKITIQNYATKYKRKHFITNLIINYNKLQRNKSISFEWFFDSCIDRVEWYIQDDELNRQLGNSTVSHDDILKENPIIFDNYGLPITYSDILDIKKLILKAKKQVLLSLQNKETQVKIVDTKSETVNIIEKKNTDELKNKIKEELEPLKGFYKTKKLLSDDDFNRLIKYINIIIDGGYPETTQSFPIINISNQFIRKSIHFAYLSNFKKGKKEFVKIVKLFIQFDENEISTISSKFSSFDGDYSEILKQIKKQ